MSRILLISVNRETVPYPVFPIGVWMLKSHLAERGIEAEVADLFLLGDLDALEQCFLKSSRFDAIAISIRNIDNLVWPETVSYLPEIRACVERVRRYFPPEKIMLGGSGYSIFGSVLLDALGLAQGISGPGEQALTRWLAASDSGPAPDFSYYRHVPAEVVAAYYRAAGMLGLQTRRGCPHACTYCTYPQIEGRTFQPRPVAGVLEEIAALADGHDVSCFYFVDCLFDAPRAYTLQLLAELARARTRARWYAFVNPGGFDDEMAVAMVAAGCGGIEFGAESGDAAMLRALGKDYDPAQILRVSEICRRRGLPFCHYLLLGAPGESEATVRNSLELMRRCAPATVIISIGLRIYPHTPLARRLRAEGRLNPADSLLEPVFYQPENIDLRRIADLCKRMSPAHWLVPGVQASLRLADQQQLRRRGIKGPLWEYLA